jgi:hypothetical protein
MNRDEQRWTEMNASNGFCFRELNEPCDAKLYQIV